MNPYLIDLPCFSKDNFSISYKLKKIKFPLVYTPTFNQNPPPEQIITTEKKSLILFEVEKSTLVKNENKRPSSLHKPPRKRARRNETTSSTNNIISNPTFINEIEICENIPILEEEKNYSSSSNSTQKDLMEED